MKFSSLFLLLVLFSASVYPQSLLESQDPNQTMTSQQCSDLIKSAWDQLKVISDDYKSHAAVKSEFESTSEYNDRVRKGKDEYVSKIRKFYSDNKLNSKVFSVWLKAELNKYDADNQTYGIKSSTQILIQPKKQDIHVVLPGTKYVTTTEKNSGGYRRAYIHLNTNPEFTWFVNKQTAQDAKSKEQNIFFKFSFSMDISYDETVDLILLQLVPAKIALMNQAENFTYWSEDIR